MQSEDPQPSQKLTFLGLSPALVSLSIGDNDLNYFIEILNKNPKLQKNIDQKYPNLMKKIRELDAKKDLEKIHETEHQKILLKLQQGVRGQAHATELVASILSSQVDGINNNNNFLFVGPSGTGKTEFAKRISSFKKQFIRFDMNQFPNESDFSKLFGSATGTVGSESRSYLAQVQCFL